LGRWRLAQLAVCRKSRTESKPASGPKITVQAPTKKVGRPRAKHSSADYAQMSAYIHKEVRNKVKIRLFEQEGEFSGLVESLLRHWLKEPK
jgi:hypothetical protein